MGRDRVGFRAFGWKSALFQAGAVILAAAPIQPAAAADWSTLGTQLLQPVAVESQLPNSSIPMAMVSDGRGFLWVGTQNGLARWDGLRFRIYNAGPDAQSLPDSQIETVFADKAGQLWVGTLSAGLARFDPTTGTFHRYASRDRGLNYAGVHAIAEADDGDLWVGAESGLDKLTPSTGHVVHVTAKGAVQAALASGVTALVASPDALWIGTDQGLLRRDRRSGEITVERLPTPTSTTIKALLIDAKGRLWVGTDGAGAFVVEAGGRSVRPVGASLGNGVMGAGMRIRALLQTSPGEIWLGTYDDGILSVDTADLKAHRLRLGNGELLYGDQNIRALAPALDGQIFIAANSAITRYDPRHTAFTTIMGGEAPTAVLAERTPVALFEDASRRLWIGFISHGVDIIDPRTGKVVHAPPRPGGLPQAPVRALSQADRGVFVGTDSGLFHSDSSARTIVRVAQPGRAPDATVMAMTRAGDRLWLADRDGVWGYRVGADDTLTREFVVAADRLSDKRVQVLTVGPQGRIWIGTSGGLNVFDPKTGRLVVLDPAANDTATPRGFISSINFDREGRVWVTTFGHGVSVAQSPEAALAHEFRHVDVADGLPNSNANKVLEDAHGGVWASTDAGLGKIDPRTWRVTALQLAQGVPVASFFYNTGLVSHDGDLLFGGRGGLEIVQPDHYRPSIAAPPLRITEVHEGGRTLPGDPFMALKPGQALRLPPGGGGLEVGFAALDYGDADHVRYAYRLVGASDAWTEVDASRPIATFSNLGPGAYTLEIRALDPSGGWSPRLLRLPIAVAPAWNQTLWFHMLEALAGVAVLVGVVLWRTRNLNRRRRELEQLVEERTHALQAQKDLLEVQAIQLADARVRAEGLAQAKSDFLANMSHEIRTPLNGVVAVADMLARSPLPEKARGMAEIIRASGDTLQRLLSDILDMARIESGKITLENAPFQAGDMARAVAGLSQLKCDEKGVALCVEIDPALDEMVMGDMVRVRQIVTNLLSNAVKFTDRGEVRLSADRTADGTARFTVSDTGVGFDMADKAKVLGRFEQADSSITRRFGGTGLGLSICADLAALMGGTLDCEGRLGEGARFWVELPLESSDKTGLAGGNEAIVSTREAGGEARLRVLLADDHPTNRQVVRLILEELVELVSVEDGAQAVAAIRAGGFDLILMDMQMPVMDGLSALQEIRRLEAAGGRARTPAVMLTANALPEHLAAARAAGADLHLAKPFTASDLFCAIDEALAGAEARPAAA